MLYSTDWEREIIVIGDRGVFKATMQELFGVAELNYRETSATVVGNLVDIQTRYLPNTS
jgi:hypothetical protein